MSARKRTKLSAASFVLGSALASDNAVRSSKQKTIPKEARSSAKIAKPKNSTAVAVESTNNDDAFSSLMNDNDATIASPFNALVSQLASSSRKRRKRMAKIDSNEPTRIEEIVESLDVVEAETTTDNNNDQDNNDEEEAHADEPINIDNDDVEIDDDDNLADDPYERHFGRANVDAPSEAEITAQRSAAWRTLATLRTGAVVSTDGAARAAEEARWASGRVTGDGTGDEAGELASLLHLKPRLADAIASEPIDDNQTRDVIIANNKRLTADADAEIRDHAFTRPRVLILAPHRSTAHAIVHELMRIAPPSLLANGVERLRKFDEEFGEQISPSEQFERKPADFQETFAGNTDDSFRIGVKFTRSSIKLFAEFYQSDLIIASPLGLRLLTEAGVESTVDDNEDPLESSKKRRKTKRKHVLGDRDFLSSIEICILTHCDALLAQNWQHTVTVATFSLFVDLFLDLLTCILKILQYMNQMPHASHDAPMQRVRYWYLDQRQKYLRQTLLECGVVTPELNVALMRYCHNLSGRYRVRESIAPHGAISLVVPRVRYLFHRIDERDATLVPAARLEYLQSSLLNSLSNVGGCVMIYCATYFDFVRVRNLLRAKQIRFSPCCEYTAGGAVRRARTEFQAGKIDFLLVSERFHFYHRYVIRGVKSLVLFGVPSLPTFFVELASMLPDGATCLTVFARTDRLALERCVGMSRAAELCTAAQSVHLFC